MSRHRHAPFRPALRVRPASRLRRWRPVLALMLVCLGAKARAAPNPATVHFRQTVQPLLAQYCYDCHGDGMTKGGIAFDELKTDAAILDRDLWWKVLKNTRAGLMPPRNKRHPSAQDQARLEQWIKFEAFGIDPKNPDPGRVTVRRLNRVEYRNTIRDLLGVDFNTENEFPPDDTGYGFDNIGDVLTLSPMLLEKYLAAAQSIVARASLKALLTGEGPADQAERRVFAAAVLREFASRAFRRPIDSPTADRLVGLAESLYSQTSQTFEAGMRHAMVAVLASPRFLFREEGLEPGGLGHGYPLIDEYSLASRLSYFLWSSMPDAELFRLAEAGALRRDLVPQLNRMLADRKARAFIRNFTGQWLQARDLDTVDIDARAVLAREEPPDPERERLRARLRELRGRPEASRTSEEKAELAKLRAEFGKRSAPPRVELTGELRQAMRRETEKYFEYVVRENRPLVELLDSDYTFLNERLADYYGVDDITGDELHLVKLPADSPRGGILGQGTFLLVTSNPTRTSPVKRGRFILDNLLGLPSPPPPPNIPPLEDAAKLVHDHEPTLRETLATHRGQPLCSSCHNRMDPLGLALENFNALGLWREQERHQPIDASGELITGESFHDARDLKHILATNHRRDFYRCLTEKLLTYALGRGIEYYDVETVDRIVERLENDGGRFSTLLTGIVQSAPFQRRRGIATLADAGRPAPTRKPTARQ